MLEVEVLILLFVAAVGDVDELDEDELGLV